MNGLQPDLAEMLTACGAPSATFKDTGADEATDENASVRVVFAEPWHAEAVATTLYLSRRGLFTWKEWVDVFSAEILQAPEAVPEDANSAYYRQWLAALQTILTTKQVLETREIARTQEDWRRSYLHTRHGEPVVFQRELPLPSTNASLPHDHDHHYDGHAEVPGPVAVSHARC